MKKYIKFTGKFTDLIPTGWSFWKAFARNYRVYTWSKTEHGQSMNVWQHLGGYLEIADLYSRSHIFIEAIQNGQLEKVKSGRKHGQYWLKINLLDNTIHDRSESAEHRADELELYYQNHCKDSDFKSELVAKYYEKWREFNLQQSTVDKLKELLDKGMIVVAEDKRVKR